METVEIKKVKKRYNSIDVFRGIAVLNMVIYHFVWDLVYFGFNIPWYSNWVGYIWQQYICWSFIFISGISFNLGNRKLKRGLEVFLSGIALTILTIIFVPQNRVIFGILTLIGSCMIMLCFVEKWLKKINIYLGAILSFCIFIFTKNIPKGYVGFSTIKFELPSYLYSNIFSAYFGFPAKDFYSTDYFPVFPWIFLFIFGFYTYLILEEKNYLNKLKKIKCKPLEYIGKNALLIYMIHQIILYGIAYLLALILIN